MLEQLREHIHTSDTELLLALLTMLSEVSHNAANVQVTRLAAMGLFHTVLAPPVLPRPTAVAPPRDTRVA